MNFDIRPFIGVEVALVLAIFALIAWRKAVARGEDDSLHVLQAETISHQATVAHKLEVIDKWGKATTAIAVVFGLLVAAAYIYQVWVQGTQVPAGF
jgi:hypothetical protein